MQPTILVPFDGSPLAERSLPYAAELARAGGARLILLRVIPVTPLIPQAFAEEEERADLEAVAAGWRKDGLDVEACVRYTGYEPVSRIILDEARQRRASIVMSTHGRGGAGRWLYGSVADEVLRRSDVPILLVPPDAAPGWAAHRPFTILLPLDGSALAEGAVEPAVGLAAAMGGDVALLRVVEPAAYPLYPEAAVYIPVDEEAAVAEARGYLEGVAGGLRAGGRRVTIEVAVGRPVDVIARRAHEAGVAAIALATHGRGGVARFAMGSVATGVVSRVGVPILAVRPAGLRAAPPLLTPAARDVVHSAESAALAFTRPELQLIRRALQELTYTKSSVPLLVEPARDLVRRLEAVEAALEAFEPAAAAEPAPAGTVTGASR